jgi:hypothetical protein
MTTRTLAIAALVLLALAATGLNTTTGVHDSRVDTRIVHPYNQQVMTHIPVVAGYEPFPRAPMCAAGTAAVLPIYEEDFSAGLGGWEKVGTPLSGQSMGNGFNNLWSLTSWSGNRGTDSGYEGQNRLYFGLTSGSRAGTYNNGHVAGTMQSPAIELPLGPSVLTWATKWEMEYLIGYDHMFVELLAPDGKIHWLCHNNSEARVDQAGVNGNSAYQSCSPFHYSPCATMLGGGLNSQFPAWENRHVTIPPQLWGQEVKIRFTFDSSDGAANHFHGWSVTDVVIGAPIDP